MVSPFPQTKIFGGLRETHAQRICWASRCCLQQLSFPVPFRPDQPETKMKQITSFALIVLVMQGADALPQGAPTLECARDTQTCMTACLNASQTSHPILDCRRSCSEFNSARRGYCFPIYFEQAPQRRNNSDSLRAVKAQIDACDNARCQPTQSREITACAEQHLKRQGPDQLEACTRAALQRSSQCRMACWNEIRGR